MIRIKNLYKDVDIVLDNYNMSNGTVSAEAQMQTVAHSLHKMMQSDKWCCVSTIKECAKICQVCIKEFKETIEKLVLTLTEFVDNLDDVKKQ